MTATLQRALILSAVLIATACVSDNEKKNMNDEPGALDLIICEEPRSSVCTREYKPVCATNDDGDTMTAATACTACSDAAVVGYREGGC